MFFKKVLCLPCGFYKKNGKQWRCYCNKRPGLCIHPECKKEGERLGLKVGTEICEHKKERVKCVVCGGSQVCPHNRRKSDCKECGGTSICEHGTYRKECIPCGGSQVCIHKKLKRDCKLCDPRRYIINLRRRRRNSAIKSKNNTHTLKDLCMTPEEWLKYLNKTFEDRYGRPVSENDEIHIDEIIPCSVWNLPDDNKYCWHYLNSQWLLAKDNMEKKAKYTEKDKRAMVEKIDLFFESQSS
jgi:hypothetical protein